MTKNDPIITDFSSSTGLLDFNTTFKIVGDGSDNSNLKILILSQKSKSSTESIKVGYSRSSSAFYFDREIPNTEINNNPFFTKYFIWICL